MKIRSLNDFQDAVDQETAWRRHELSTIKFEVKKAKTDKPAGRVALRSSLALLYAHWEGWVKSVSKLYIAFLNSQKVRISELTPPYLGTALRQRLIALGEEGTLNSHISFATFITNGFDDHAEFRDNDLPIKSNLNFSRFKELILRFGLNTSEYDTLENKIDAELLYQRNHIAHGEWIRVEKEAYLELHELIVDQLNTFTTDLLNSAANQSFRSSATKPGSADGPSVIS